MRIFAVPNGGLRNKSVAKTMKAEGLSAGVPDLYIPAWNVWIEMKKKKGGRVSDAQKDWITYLESIGHTVFVCRGYEEAIGAIVGFSSNPT